MFHESLENLACYQLMFILFRRQAEANVCDIISPTLFGEEIKDGGFKASLNEEEAKDSNVKKAIVENEDDTKERAGSLPPIPPRERIKRHEYTEIPEPGELVKKALSTGKISDINRLMY